VIQKLDDTKDLDVKIARYLTVAMTDPDAPSQFDRKWSEFCHWIVTKVLVTNAWKGDTANKQKDIMSYKPPAPPAKTGYHRYVLIVFAAQDGSEKPDLTPPPDRKRWGNKKSGHGVADWAEDNGLIPVGTFAIQLA
jgi:phosphatidylethanolamine-binding protein (PEBP) family uncharacterized protein